MRRKPFEVFPGCGDDLFFIRLAKLVLDLERGRRLGREKQGAHKKKSPEETPKRRGFYSRHFDLISVLSLQPVQVTFRVFVCLFTSCTIAL